MTKGAIISVIVIACGSFFACKTDFGIAGGLLILVGVCFLLASFLPKIKVS